MSSPAQDSGTDDTDDSDVDATGQTACIALDPGENDDTNDAGAYLPKASIGDQVWDDLDEDGTNDPGEPGIDGVTVFLYECGDVVGVDAPQQSDVTASGGFYGFDNLDPNVDYFVFFDPSTLPAGYVFTAQNSGTDDTDDSDVDATGQTACIALDPGENDDTNDAGALPAEGFHRRPGMGRPG
jgi:serine-aspartate repeat-containing protein C/D/E